MWFKKKSVLQTDGNYHTEKSADRTTDLRTTDWTYFNNSSSINNSGLPSAADAGNYFYLPALGSYYHGQLNGVGSYGAYWSSSARPNNRYDTYALYFTSSYVSLSGNNRNGGYRVEPTVE